MVVCVCNAIRERDLREVARSGGCASPGKAYARLGHKAKCGQCLTFARAILTEQSATA